MTRPLKGQQWPVWDWPVRLTHWFFVFAVAAMWWTGESGLFEWHSKLGYVILTLVVTRLLWGFVGSHHARFGNFVRGWSVIKRYLQSPTASVGHNPLGALSVIALLGVLLFQGISGLFSNDDIAFDGPLSYLAGVYSHTITALHQGSWMVLQGLILLHIGAVLFYQWRKKQPILQAMLHGMAEGKFSESPPVSILRWVTLVVLVAIVLSSLLWLAPSPPAYY
tara:strand:+ start:170 stop:835 length:666 start_codon:yes stop_codon:yes gene_type:complete